MDNKYLAGPFVPFPMAECVLGKPCRIQLPDPPGVGLQADKDKAWIIRGSCPAPGSVAAIDTASTAPVAMTGSNMFEFSRSLLTKMSPGNFSVCWCSGADPDGCTNPAAFPVKLMDLSYNGESIDFSYRR
jgi:hypothetical protein